MHHCEPAAQKKIPFSQPVLHTTCSSAAVPRQLALEYALWTHSFLQQWIIFKAPGEQEQNMNPISHISAGQDN